MTPTQRIRATDHSTLFAAAERIEAAVQELGAAHGVLLATYTSMSREAYRVGGVAAQHDLSAVFSDVRIRDWVAGRLKRAGLGDVLDAGSVGSYDDTGFIERLRDRFTPSAQFETGRVHPSPRSSKPRTR